MTELGLCSGVRPTRSKSTTSMASLFASLERISYSILEVFAWTARDELSWSNARLATKKNKNVTMIFNSFFQVMRVIIFDQMGNVLNKFGCSKHLEFPNGVVVNDRQEIFISDNRAHCVKVFDYEGNFLRQIGGEGKRLKLRAAARLYMKFSQVSPTIQLVLASTARARSPSPTTTTTSTSLSFLKTVN